MAIKPKTFIYKTIDGCDIKADLYRPISTFGLSPVIFWIHGGALIEGSRKWIHSKQVERYTSAGYALLAIDHRLAPETLLPAIMDDLQDAYSWLINDLATEYNLDTEQIYCIGHSAGGYLALLTAYHFKPAPRAIVSFYGYCDIAGDWAHKSNGYFSLQRQVSREKAYEFVDNKPISEGQGFRQHLYTYCRQQGIIAQITSGIDPIKEPDKARLYNPIQNVDSTFPPTLFIHGEQDKDVPIEQSIIMYKELKKHNIKSSLISIPQARHLFDNQMDDPDVNKIFNDVIAFLQHQP